MFRRHARTIAAIVICFFTWTSGGVFSVAHAAVDGVKKSSPQTGPKKEGAEEKFAQLTEELRQVLADQKTAGPEKREKLLAARAELESLDAAIRADFAATEKKLKDAGLPPEILARHTKFVKHYDDNLAELKGNIERVEKAKSEAEVKVEVEKALAHLEKTKAPSRHRALDPNNLPHRQPKVIKREPRMKKEEFDRDLKKDKHAWKQAKRVMVASTGSVAGLLPPDDLAETAEVQLTPEIRAKALELGNSPVRIYEWVRNNIEFVPTWGSIQGAQMTLLTRQGNAFDTASLLIALLRAAGIHARYVTGTVILPVDKMMNWLGGFTDPLAALEFMASGGVPVKAGVSAGGQITKGLFEHVWVEAFIPFGNYRGAAKDKSNLMWVPLDASYKQIGVVSGFDVTATVPFSSDRYLSSINNLNPLHFYQYDIQSYLDSVMPDKSIVDVKGSREVIYENFKFLPGTLPYKPIVTAGKFSAISVNNRANVNIRLSSNDDQTRYSYTATTPEIAGKRITLSYQPATPADEALVAAYGGFMFNVPAYMLQVKPEIRVEGTVVLTGESTSLGNEQLLDLGLNRPNGMGESAEKMVVAGGYYAIGMDLAGVNEGSLGARNGMLRNNLATLLPAAFTSDDLIGEHLHLLSTTYNFANDKLYSSGAKVYNVAQMRVLSGNFVSIIPSVLYLFSIPRWVKPSGLEMDVRMDKIVAVARDGNLQAEKSYMEMAGLVSSYNEHHIFEAIDGFSSVSAVKALQTANQSGISIYRIDSANLNQVLPNLQVRPEVIEDIRNSVNAGYEILIPQRNVQIGDWNGIGYIVKDLVTGSGAYMISGGLAGGGTTRRSDGYQVVKLYAGPYGWVKDNIDPQTRKTIVETAIVNIGEDIAETAEDIMNLGVSYQDIGMCTGLVIKSYEGASIYLRTIAKDKGFGPPENASNMYLMIKYTPSFQVGEEGPIVGDIIFFHDTNPERDPAMKRPGDDGASHVAIVTEVEDGEVMSMIHAAGRKKGIVQVSFPDGMMQNNYRYDHFLAYGRPR